MLASLRSPVGPLDSACPIEDQAQLKMQLASFYALQGRRWLEAGTAQLKAASQADAAVRREPLYQALELEFATYNVDNRAVVRHRLKSLCHRGEPHALFHIARALTHIGSYGAAQRLLQGLETADLPEHLVWRRWSLLGEVYARRGKIEQAVDAYMRSAALSSGLDRQREQLSLAEGLLALGKTTAAHDLLTNLSLSSLAEDELELRHGYLLGLALERLGNPNAALQVFLEAYTLAQRKNYDVFELLIELGRSYAQAGNTVQAAASYDRAYGVASETERSFVSHEYGIMLSELGKFDEAYSKLWTVACDGRYEGRVDVLADLSVLFMRAGCSDKAELMAHYALNLGASAPACLTLAEIELERYAYGAALGWLEGALSAATPGDPDWLSAHILLADTLAKQGYHSSERLIRHAEQALAYLDPCNEWTEPLKAYVQRAKGLPGGTLGLLN